MYVVAVHIPNMVDVQLKKKKKDITIIIRHIQHSLKSMSLNKPTTSYKLFTKARKSSMNSTIVKRVIR